MLSLLFQAPAAAVQPGGAQAGGVQAGAIQAAAVQAGAVQAGAAQLHIDRSIASGDFEAAYHAAAGGASLRSHIQAAKAASYQAIYVEKARAEQIRWLELAVAAARQAVELDPGSAAAHVELFRAEGVLATYRGVLENLDAAPRLKGLFDRTLELDPDNVDALVALAQWHIELTERGVGWLYGANRARAMELFGRALELEPQRLNLRVEYASALRLLGREDEAREQLRIALELPARDAVDRYEQERARRLLAP